MSVWIRNVFLGNAFSCNLDDKEWLIRRSREQKNKNLFSIIKLSSNSSKSASSSPLSAAFSLEQFSKSNCRQEKFFFAEKFFLGFENDKVLFNATRNLHRITIYLKFYYEALQCNRILIILRIL